MLKERWLAIPEERRDLISVVALGALVFLPWLGAVGFWDPWEPHYGEVAREMIDRRDWVHPHWEHAYFFSKPILTFWLMAPMMLLAGTDDAGGMGVYTEWLVRLPFAALAILSMALVYLAARRTLGRRVGLFAALVSATSPMYFLMARQAVTDIPFVALVNCAIAAWVLGALAPSDGEPRPGWLYTSYAFMGLATLAKGILGFALPGAVVLLYLAVSGEWRILLRMRMARGAVIVLAIAAPWYATMFAFDGVDDESKSFFTRFIVHDHLNRLTKGVHTTTPGGTFAYYIEQMGFAMFPWVAVVPGAIMAASTADWRRRDPEARGHMFALAWTAVSFATFAFSTTKFHHYALPMVAPVAILCAHFMDRVLEEGVTRYMPAIVLGAFLFGLVAKDLWLQDKHLTDLFVYNYTRPYPDAFVDPRRAFSAIYAGGAAIALWGVPWVRRIAAALVWLPAAGAVALLRFFAFVKEPPAWLARVRDEARTAEEQPVDRRYFAAGLSAMALCFALFVSWHHWRKLTPHWSQRDLVWTYHHERAPGEPLISYSMNWRGETFYTRNRVRQIMNDAERLRQAVSMPGREWVLCEQGRFNGMKQALGPDYKVRVVDSSSNKFFLATVD